MKFDDWLRGQLHQHKWTVMDLARAIADAEGISPDEKDKRSKAISSNISNVRLGKANLGEEYAKKIASAFGVKQTIVFRVAGFIDDSDDDIAITEIYDALTPEERDKMIAFGEDLITKRKRPRQTRNL